jgi:hypothetical protein
MSLSALNASVGGASLPAEHPRDPSGRSAGASQFAAIVSALAGEDLHPGAHAAGVNGAAPSQSAALPRESPAIDAALAALVRGALVSSTTGGAAASPTVGGALRRASKERGADAGANQSTAGSAAATPAPAAQDGAAANLALAGLLTGAHASPAAQQVASASSSAAAGGAQWPALRGGGAWASSDPATGGPAASPQATTAQNGVGADLALAGLANGPLTIQTAANGDPSLGISAIRTRTYLGIDSAARSEAKNPISRSQGRSAVTASAAPDAAGSAAAADAAAAPTHPDTPSGKPWTPAHKESRSAPVADASLGAVNAAADLAATGAAPIAVSQLADRLASAASDMASSATPSAAAAGAGTAQAVKELQIDLDPADLGAVSVTMRLAGGKLSIVMEVATPSTLKAIEGERDAIAERLGLTSQSLEALIIKPAATNATNAESDNAQSQKPGSQEYAQFDSNGESRGNGRSSSRRESAANQGDPGAAARQPASRRGFGDLVV